MSKPTDKPDNPVTVTVRPDGSYYVERAKPEARPRSIAPVALAPVGRGPSPIAVAVTASLRDFAGIAVAARAVAPALGKYGVLAAIGVGVLNAWAESKPPPNFRRFQLRRIRRTRP